MDAIQKAEADMQRTLQLAMHAKSDRIRAQNALLACIAKEEVAAKDAKNAALKLSAAVKAVNDELRGAA